MRLLAVAAVFALLATTPSSGIPPRHRAIDRLPLVFIWAWERPEDLRDLHHGIGVAFLAQTISIQGDDFRVVPRRQPLRVSPATALVAVTRIESDAAAGGPLRRPPIDALVSVVAATADLHRVSAVQLDFDAVASDRPLYRQLIQRLRDRLPPTVPISITALASWCVGDNWLGGLPIDEAVPMLFRMGPVNEPFRRIAVARESASPACRGAIGISLDEPIDMPANGRRVYVFNPRAWTGMTLLQARNRIIE